MEEYRQHLEKVYKLCAVCEDFLATKLLEQDRKMANKLLEVRLERSRLNSSSIGFKKNTTSQWLPFMQSFLALTVFSLLQDYSQITEPSIICGPFLVYFYPHSLIPGWEWHRVSLRAFKLGQPSSAFNRPDKRTKLRFCDSHFPHHILHFIRARCC